MIRATLSTITQILFGAVVATFLALTLAPTAWWYEYKSIVPAKPEYQIGEKLRMVSNIIVHTNGLRIVWDDQLRCLTENGDRVVKTTTFPGALKGTIGELTRTPWAWGDVPEETPQDVPCYIRSIQTLTLWFGIKRTTVVYGETFRVVG